MTARAPPSTEQSGGRTAVAAIRIAHTQGETTLPAVHKRGLCSMCRVSTALTR